MKKFIIIANGPFLARDIIIEAIQDRQILALDGAADKLLTLSISPHIILGDFDSIHPQTQNYWGIVQDFQNASEIIRDISPKKSLENLIRFKI